MKKIGILTFEGVPNYGAFAQACALNKVLKNSFKDVEVKHIAYLHRMHKDLYFKKTKPALTSYRCLFSPRFYVEWIRYCIDS